ncbi:MAG: mannosyltransferase family protein, partial [Candidatus Daviesbacteria bacterium]|nr:mannosyltransferase family protein [Candidatus Daviesbacteria bacterium]
NSNDRIVNVLKKYIYPISFPLIIFLAWRLIIILFQIFIQPYSKIGSNSLTIYQRLFESWTYYWDTGHYLYIVQNGYSFPRQNFFPLWSFLIKLFSIFTGGILSTEWVAYILTFILGLTTFIFFYLLAARLMDKKNAGLALIIFASFPSAMFLHAGYTENLFLSLTLLSFWLLEKKQFLLSSLIGGLSSATRSVGISIGLVFLVMKAPIKKKIIYFLLGLSGLLGYMIYLGLQFGDPLLFLKAHQEWCGSIGQCKMTFPFVPLIPQAQLFLAGWLRPNLSSPFLDWISSIIFILLLWPIFKKLNKTYFIYSAVVILMPLSTGMVVSMIRYVLVAFPAFFVIPQIIKNKWVLFLLALFFFLLQLRFVALFTNRIWVA